ncbi:MAG: methyltransferase domain-containing protein [Verrucomicrobia bacterium]|nr:methyltransferase domain-containing protein [Verrucomicrobiota bacterium]
MSINQFIRKKLRPRTVFDYTAELVKGGDCKSGLDIGCGSHSDLSAFRPALRTVGIDAFPMAIEMARAKNLHDDYLVADILREDSTSILERVNNGEKFDIVSLYGVIEHVPKHLGFELLRRCEQLTSKYVILETPNGFVEQGPEFGNEFQRHLSGWFIHDFEGIGYENFGTTGTKYLRDYMAGPKYNFPMCITLDEVLTLLLRINKRPKHAFNLVALKDVRGTYARHKTALHR